MRYILPALALSVLALGCSQDRTDREIDRLIQELPVENARQIMIPGEALVFAPSPGGTSEDSPAHRLTRIGRPAVPKLIEALSDTRLTHTQNGGMHDDHVLQVNEIVVQILDRITGRNLQGYQGFDPAEINAEASKWYAETAGDCELADLKHRLTTGEDSSAVDGIYSRFPLEATAAVVDALHKPGYNGSHLVLVDGLYRHLGKRATAFLTTQARSDPDLAYRVAAATWLAEEDPKTAAEILVKEYRQFKGEDQTADGFGRSEFIKPILSVKESTADECLFEGLANRSVNFRADVVGLDSVDEMDLTDRWDSKTLEKLLVSELTDESYECGLGDAGEELGDIAPVRFQKSFPPSISPIRKRSAASGGKNESL
jgi:hypothetical protein